jgi:hypothetical protein
MAGRAVSHQAHRRFMLENRSFDHMLISPTLAGRHDIERVRWVVCLRTETTQPNRLFS